MPCQRAGIHLNGLRWHKTAVIDLMSLDDEIGGTGDVGVVS